MKRLLVGLPLLLLVCLVLSAYWVLHTDAGASWVWSKIEDSDAVSVSSSRTDGNFSDGFRIQNLGYHSTDMDVLVGHAEVRAGPGLWPLSVQVRDLSLRDVSVIRHSRNFNREDNGDPVDVSAILRSMNLPLPLEIHDARLSNLSLQQDDHPPRVLADSLVLEARVDEQLSVHQLAIKGPWFEAGVRGRLTLEPPHDLAVSVNGMVDLSEYWAATEWVVPFTLEGSGNFARVQFDFASPDHGMELEGELNEPFTEPAWVIRADLGQLNWPTGDGDDLLTLTDSTLESQGTIDDWSVELGTRVSHGDSPEVHLVLSGLGSETGFHITSAGLDGPGVGLSVNGRLDWSPEVETSVAVVISELDLSAWLVDWPEEELLTGELELAWSREGLEIPRGNLRVAGTELEAKLEADVDIDANSVDALLEWTGLNWPLGNPDPDFASRSGELRIEGNLDQWTSTGHLALKLGNYPGGKLNIEGEGGRTSARIRIPGGEVLGGNISGEAGLDWMDGIRWDANVRTHRVDPEPLLPGWPGRLDMELSISAEDLTHRYDIDLKSLRGQLRGVELEGRGGLVVADDQLSFEQFELRTSEALLWLDGTSTGPDGLAMRFDGSLPSMLLQGARGKLQFEGRYATHTDQPVLDIQMEALDMAWSGLVIKALAVKTRMSDPAAVIPAIDLNASGLSWQDQTINELSISFDPEAGTHRLRAELAGERFGLDAAMSLAPQNEDRPFDSPWSGLLDSMVISFNQEQVLTLLEPASFDVSPEAARVEPVCMQIDDAAGVCLSGDYQSGTDWSVLADVKAIPVDYLREVFELDVYFDQLIDGQVEWHQPRDHAPSGGAKFRISPGQIFEPDDDEPLLKTSEGLFGFVLQNGNLEAGELDIEFPGFGFVDFDFEVLNIMENGARKLSGRAVTQLNDIKLLGHLAWPAVDDIGGHFESDILLGGNLSEPDFSGGFRLSDGYIRYIPLGVNLEGIDFEGQVEKRDRGHLNGQFRAGEGLGTVSGQFLFEDLENLKMDLALSGDRLLLFSTDTLELKTETDLKLGLSPGRLDINGRIHIPSARFTPTNLILGKVTDSEDLVIESRDAAVNPEVEETDEESLVFGQLEVSLGDDVFIKIPGVETHVRGSVLNEWSGDPVPMANGNYRLNGKLDIYGPILQINNGSISFPDVPANNPVLSIRAEREIYGNTQIGAAGVQIIGTLKRPKLEAYTMPVTNEDRAWALLVTGSDFDQAQGVGGFDVGTYIAPKLYVSYGVSLFEDENVVSARYDLKKGFGIKVTSGQRETGFDMSYTIEKN